MSESLDRSELTALEAALGKLSPRPGALDRDRLLFEAGRASARPGWLWPTSAAVASLMAASLALVLVFRPVPVTERTIVVRKQSAPSPVPPRMREPVTPWIETVAPPEESTEAVQSDYLRRRQEVLRWGVEMLPSPGPQSAPSGRTLTPAAIRARPERDPDRPF